MRGFEAEKKERKKKDMENQLRAKRHPLGKRQLSVFFFSKIFFLFLILFLNFLTKRGWTCYFIVCTVHVQVTMHPQLALMISLVFFLFL